MTILAKFEKQPSDVQDFDIDFSEWLTGMLDSAPGPTGLEVAVDEGITLLASILNNGVAKVWLAGGVDGMTYKVTTTVTTTGGRVKQAEIKLKVREY